MRDFAAGPAPASDLSALLGRDAPVPGESVVHLDHGVSKLEGLEAVEGPTGTRDFLRLSFRDGDTLLVPVSALSRVWRHGPDGDAAKLDPLDADGWRDRRDRAVAEIARDARALARRAGRRHAAPPEPMAWDEAALSRIASGFPHPLTPDQDEAVREILCALREGRPQERLLIGDVGFGKTEVILRAVAAVALAGGQAALIAPTMLLARQHFEGFRQRLAAEGIAVVECSGLSDVDAARAALADGSAQVAIGTHALASRHAEYADLRLVVIDEEHRFGVRHKAALRHLAGGRHLIGMSATPIPQTLAAAQVGILDVSPLTTAPAAREAASARLAAWDDGALAAALIREAGRGGRSFVVVPRVADIEAAAEAIRREAPDLKLAVAHGQMPEGEAAEALAAFASGDAEVLLATTIVENGIDVPEAGTIALLGADRFGLAALYQLRGRVGRGGQEGRLIALWTGEPTDEARARVALLEEAAGPGAGLEVAMGDAGARGAGSLVGTDQSGHLGLLGVGLHRHLVLRALRGQEGAVPAVEHDAPGRLPEDMDANARIALHALLARAASEEEWRAAAEAAREAGAGDETEALIAAARRRMLARRCGVTALSVGPKGAVLEFGDDARLRDAAGRVEGTVKDRQIVLKGDGAALADEALEGLAA